jgi:hypothetical protein
MEHSPVAIERRTRRNAQGWLPHATGPVRMPMSYGDADKLRWIRANRHNFDLLDALRSSVSDADFDAQLEAAMRMSVASPSYFGPLDDIPTA